METEDIALRRVLLFINLMSLSFMFLIHLMKLTPTLLASFSY